MDDVRLIPVSDIREPRSLLRLVDRNSIEYLELKDSIAQFGFTSSISVRPAKDEPGRFEIIGGVTRYTIAKELNLDVMPCIIKHNVNDDELLILQLQENAQGVETKPIDYARQIRTILARQPEMDIAALSVRLKKSPSWIGRLLGLLKLPERVQKSINRGEMPLDSAYLLSKMPRKLAAGLLHDAKTLSATKFRPIATAALKRFHEAVGHGRLEAFYVREFTPHPYLRHLKEIQAEMAHHQAGPELVASLGCKTPIDGFYAACQWFVHLDPESIKAQREAAHARERSQLEQMPDEDLT